MDGVTRCPERSDRRMQEGGRHILQELGDATHDAYRIPSHRNMHRNLQVVGYAHCQIPYPLCERTCLVEELQCHLGGLSDVFGQDRLHPTDLLEALDSPLIAGRCFAVIEQRCTFVPQKAPVQLSSLEALTDEDGCIACRKGLRAPGTDIGELTNKEHLLLLIVGDLVVSEHQSL